MNTNKKLSFIDFKQSFFDDLPDITQLQYLQSYLIDLEAKSIIVEHNYFDRDYLSEFSAFYGTSTKGYKNICKRIHFFSESIKRDTFRRAAGGSKKSIKKVRNSYLGFTIIRPIDSTPLGRTVLKWYEDKTPSTPRIMEPSRNYYCHLAGIELKIFGLAWQQQDTAVGACATVGLWSLFHSSAFDDHHAIPTTAEITRSAHKTMSLGKNIFPSQGLTIMQLCEAIKEQGLAPVVVEGEVPVNIQSFNTACPDQKLIGFSKTRYNINCASFLRSGYPIILYGELIDNIKNKHIGCHAICVTGFRDKPSPSISPGQLFLQDSEIDYQYIHNDNLGPNVRYAININASTNTIFLETNPPPDKDGNSRTTSPTLNHPIFVPWAIIVATHEDLRLSPNILLSSGYKKAEDLCAVINIIFTNNGITNVGLTVGARFIKLSEYIECELANTISASQKILSHARLALIEKVPPMSLHIGVVRIALDDATPLVDILYDTTDSHVNNPIYAHVDYSPITSLAIQSIKDHYGVQIKAY